MSILKRGKLELKEGMFLEFPQHNKIDFYQDHRGHTGVPSQVIWKVKSRSNQDSVWLEAFGYGIINSHPDSYGNGSISVYIRDIKKEYITDEPWTNNPPKEETMTNEMIMFNKEIAEPIKDYDFNSDEFQGFLNMIEKNSRILMRDKDKDYGGSWQQDGVFSAHFNLKRKFDRLHNLFMTGFGAQTVVDETAVDTMVDLRNYITLYIAFMMKKDSNAHAIVSEMGE